MMIDLGKAQIFERKMPQTVHSIIGRELPFSDLIEKLADRDGVQKGTHYPKEVLAGEL